MTAVLNLRRAQPKTLPRLVPAATPAPAVAASAGVRVAVLIPCCNEEAAVPRVVAGFRASLPEAAIYVYDNNSRDCTVEVARQAGAVVRTERLQGKGNVVRRMFADVEADVFVLVDGDDTYDAGAAPRWSACCWTARSTWSPRRGRACPEELFAAAIVPETPCYRALCAGCSATG